MNMGSNDADTDEGLNEEKPFSPMYPVFNFGQPVEPVQQSQPPAYEYALPHLPPKLGFQEKKGF